MASDFSLTKQLFNIPKNMIYLDGNSLGPPTKTSAHKVGVLIDQKWGKLLVSGWNKDNWIDQPLNVGNRIAKLIGAENNHVILGDTLSIKLYQALFSAISLQKNRKVLLSDNGNFPSDLYIAQGLIHSLDKNYELRVVETKNILDKLTDEIAVLFLTEVDYRTGRKHDMRAINTKARELGILTVWDLAHSVGAFPIELAACECDFAVGCTYKYLNGGPGSPGFIYVAPKHTETIEVGLKGWLGHIAPFNFEQEYLPASGVNKMRIGTPPVVATACLEAALDVFDLIDMGDLRKRSIDLTELFINEIDKSCPMLKLASPRHGKNRGSHVSYHFNNGYAAIQSLIEHNIICDFRMPDLMRFGFNPLFIDYNDVLTAAKTLASIMQNKKWNRADFKVKKFVT
jgi:kynureninase